jgi:acetylornithine deacetylase/succinyl-diaminopimelate desuccinylase-like protein
MIPPIILDKIDSNRNRYVEELLSFLRIPSVSTLSHHGADVRRAAEWVLNHLKRLGLKADLFTTERHPIVYAESTHLPDKPTLLVYGHYDVQPPDPLQEWISPPFAPQIRDGYVYARGASDDKGQFYTYLKAIEAIMAVEGKLPINIKVLVEGEEEIGSPNLGPFLKERQEMLKADAVAISDSSKFTQGVPAITYGLRGLSYLQIDVQGPRFDLHSGSFGGLVQNPIMVLTTMLASLTNPEGIIAIPGFYEDALDPQPWEREEMAGLELDEAHLKSYLGVDQLVGEPGYSPMERKSARPTLDVNGIWGGFSGEGAKTIIPARAGAKVSMRLVPNQSPRKVNQLFRDFIAELTPPGVEVHVTELHGADPVLISRNQPCVRAAERAIEVGFDKSPVFIREGGSIPIVNLLTEMLGSDSILMMGWGSPDDGAHSPNERFLLDDFHRGIRAAAALFYELLDGSN